MLRIWFGLQFTHFKLVLTQDRCYYWELVLVMRKVLMTSAFVLAQTPEEAWFLGSTVIVLALLLHDAMTPYEDNLIDWCEFMSLVSTFFVCQAGIVFKILNNPAQPSTNGRSHGIVGTLESLSVLLIVGEIFLNLTVWIRVWQNVRGDHAEDYKIRMIRDHQTTLKEKERELQLALEDHQKLQAEKDQHAQTAKDLYAQAKQKNDRRHTKTQNPLFSQDDEDDGERVGAGTMRVLPAN